jgi:hypothetical protein
VLSIGGKSIEFLTFAVTSPIDGILERVGQKEGGSSMTLDQIITVLNDLECISTTRDPEQYAFGKSYTILLLCINLFHLSLKLFVVHDLDSGCKT